jgi:SEC-C motif-containing protein
VKSSKKPNKAATPNLCPCESGKPYSACCGLYHLGQAAPNAEALMRSRYTAFVMGLEGYLLQTWHPETRPATLNLNDDPPIKWLGLQVNHTEDISATSATVAFVARYKVAGKAERLHELSQFSRVDSHWYYVAGSEQS